CLAAAFDDEHRVAIVAIEAAGRAGRPALKAPLTALAGDRRRAPLLRASALGALGALGDLGPARIVIEAHLKRGGILPLVEGAVRAAQLHGGEEGRALLKIALGSKSDRVRLITGRALLALGERAAVEAARVDWRGRARARIDAALLQADKEAPTLGDSIEMIADDPE
ncbi:hypothetical protein KJ940_06785, partial [Myxococcota bacterium]|nr:hypothetical protein [Myxococcota bacterium]